MKESEESPRTWVEAVIKKYQLNDVQQKVIMDVLGDNIATIIDQVFTSFRPDYADQALQASYILIKDSVTSSCQELFDKTSQFLRLSLNSKDEERKSHIFPDFVNNKIDHNLRNIIESMNNLAATRNATQEICDELTIYKLGKVLSLEEIKEIDQETVINAMNQLEYKIHGRESFVDKDNYNHILDNYNKIMLNKLGGTINQAEYGRAVFEFSGKILGQFFAEFYPLTKNTNIKKEDIRPALNDLVDKLDFTRSNNYATSLEPGMSR